VRTALATPRSERSADAQAVLAAAFAAREPALAKVRAELAAFEQQLGAVRGPRTPVLRQLPADARRTTRLHRRGSFLDQGEPVTPGVPAVLPPLPPDAPTDRLGLARWLVAPANPLTSRVTVNRLWQALFGRGLVATGADFGTQGEAPSHPELLDWLAREFVARDYRVKELLRLIVTSATYRQSSRVLAEHLELDPQDRLLARAPRFRLDAELLRDQALALAGLLSEKRFGPSVMPPQPDGVWRLVYNNDRWVESTGEDRHRRGLYTFWRRTAPHPAMVALDAPSREVCVDARIRTNTPLQALVLWNDPQFVEAAKALGRRIEVEGGATPFERAVWAFRLCTCREPTAREVDRLLAYWEAERDWGKVASVLLNLDEVLTRT
jgi:hypothetical protein